jgi:hypothetical protein
MQFPLERGQGGFNGDKFSSPQIKEFKSASFSFFNLREIKT